jgi:hypothetical protein
MPEQKQTLIELLAFHLEHAFILLLNDCYFCVMESNLQILC